MDNQRIKQTKKTKLTDFNLEEIRGWMIQRMNDIETKIDFIICDYFEPTKNREFKKIMLNSSIITIGGKMKILRNIKTFDNKIIVKIGDLSRIRNAFAHLPIVEHIFVSVSHDENGEFKSSKISKITSNIEVMNSEGVLKTKNANILISEFSQWNKEIREYLLNFNKSS
ncbi:hypothetical protein [Mariniflexile sp.]|uniref:hypothetical protein n=1 Tax=Mariniflexile sp. TaxID=1979402 RepID=UPI0035691AB8